MLPRKMLEKQPTGSNPPAHPRSPGGGRRRGRRGGRGRGPRRSSPGAPAAEIAGPAPEEPKIQAAASGEVAAPAPVTPVSEQLAQAGSPAKQIEPPIRLHEMPVRPAPSKQKIQPPVPAVVPATVPAAPAQWKTNKPQRPAEPGCSTGHAVKPGGSVIGRTVEEVRQIVESLEQALEQMEEVLRLVELAEHQKFADERELESLRRALHKLQPPHRERREGGR
jgi:hypothetical protein